MTDKDGCILSETLKKIIGESDETNNPVLDDGKARTDGPGFYSL